MDWTKQTQEMLKSWNETQQKMWGAWLAGVQGAGQSAAADAWQKTLDTWQKSVNDTFEAQGKLVKLWLDSMQSGEGKPASLSEWSKQTEEMIARLQESQRQLWDSGFAALRKADLRSMPGSWEQQAKQIFQDWQDATRKAMEAQAELIANLTKR